MFSWVINMQNDFDSIIYYLSCLKEVSNKHEYWFYKLLIVGDDFNAISEFINSANEHKLFKNVDVVFEKKIENFNSLKSKKYSVYRLKETRKSPLDEKIIVCDEGNEIYPFCYKFRIVLENGIIQLYSGDEMKYLGNRFYVNRREITDLNKKNCILRKKK